MYAAPSPAQESVLRTPAEQAALAADFDDARRSPQVFADFTFPWYTGAILRQPVKQQSKDFIRTTAAAGLSAMGVTALRRWQQARDPRVTILTYHGISARNFERHLQWLTAHYHIVSLAEAVQWVGGNDRDASRRVVLTFDDGYKSFHHDLWPLLRKYATPATLFAVSHLVGTDQLLWWDLIDVMIARAKMRAVEVQGQRWKCDSRLLVAHAKTLPEDDKLRWITDLRTALTIDLPRSGGTPFELCTWDELRELAADPLVTIGGHTCTHPILAQVSKHVAQAEITEGRAILQNNLQLPVNFFCYPNGRTTDFTAEHVKLVQDAGFDCAVTTVEDLCAKGSDSYRLPRKNVSGQFTTAALDCKLAGLWWKAE